MNADAQASIHFDRGILVGVDEKPLSEHVVRMGEELSRKLAAPVHRVRAVPRLPDFWPGLDPARGEALTVELLDSARKATEDRIRPILVEFAAKAPESARAGKKQGATVLSERSIVEVLAGHPAEVLLAEARSRNAGLLVLGAHGKRGHLDFGNTLRAVYAKSTVPVWVQPGPVSPILRILAAVDLSEDSLIALGAARILAKAFGAKVHAIHCCQVNALAFAAQIDSTWGVYDFPYEEIVRSNRAEFDKKMSEFDWKGVPHEIEFLEASPIETLLERSEKADLVVLGTHGRTGLASVVLGGVAYSVLKRSTKPTLAVPRAGRSFRI